MENAASIKVILFGRIGGKFVDEDFEDLMLLLFNFFLNRSFKVMVLNVKELVQKLSNGLLVHMVEQVVNYLRLWREDIRNQVLLLSVNEKRDKFGEIASEDWVDWSVSGFQETEKTIK